VAEMLPKEANEPKARAKKTPKGRKGSKRSGGVEAKVKTKKG